MQIECEESFIGRYPIRSETFVMARPSIKERREMNKWRIYRRYHRDGSWTETLERESDTWRAIRVRFKRFLRCLLRK